LQVCFKDYFHQINNWQIFITSPCKIFNMVLLFPHEAYYLLKYTVYYVQRLIDINSVMYGYAQQLTSFIGMHNNLQIKHLNCTVKNGMPPIMFLDWLIWRERLIQEWLEDSALRTHPSRLFAVQLRYLHCWMQARSTGQKATLPSISGITLEFNIFRAQTTIMLNFFPPEWTSRAFSTNLIRAQRWILDFGWNVIYVL
jgi:hypothetical protein